MRKDQEMFVKEVLEELWRKIYDTAPPKVVEQHVLQRMREKYSPFLLLLPSVEDIEAAMEEAAAKFDSAE